MNFLLNPPHCVMVATTSTSCANGVNQPIAFNTNIVDSYSGHSTSVNNSEYIAAVGGWYAISGQVAWATTNATNSRSSVWLVNGTAITAGDDNQTAVSTNRGPVVGAPTMEVFLNIGDFLQLAGNQSSGVTISTNAAGSLSMVTVRWVHA